MKSGLAIAFGLLLTLAEALLPAQQLPPSGDAISAIQSGKSSAQLSLLRSGRSERPEAVRFFDQGLMAFEQARFQQAAAAFLQALQVDPNFTPARYDSDIRPSPNTQGFGF